MEVADIRQGISITKVAHQIYIKRWPYSAPQDGPQATPTFSPRRNRPDCAKFLIYDANLTNVFFEPLISFLNHQEVQQEQEQVKKLLTKNDSIEIQNAAKTRLHLCSKEDTLLYAKTAFEIVTKIFIRLGITTKLVPSFLERNRSGFSEDCEYFRHYYNDEIEPAMIFRVMSEFAFRNNLSTSLDDIRGKASKLGYAGFLLPSARRRIPIEAIAEVVQLANFMIYNDPPVRWGILLSGQRYTLFEIGLVEDNIQVRISPTMFVDEPGQSLVQVFLRLHLTPSTKDGHEWTQQIIKVRSHPRHTVFLGNNPPPLSPSFLTTSLPSLDPCGTKMLTVQIDVYLDSIRQLALKLNKGTTDSLSNFQKPLIFNKYISTGGFGEVYASHCGNFILKIGYDETKDYREKDQIFIEEADIYLKLESVQGTLIPKFYGLYDCYLIREFAITAQGVYEEPVNEEIKFPGIILENVGPTPDIIELKKLPKDKRTCLWDSIQKLHKLGFIHDDIKPGNISFTDGHCRIFDFTNSITNHICQGSGCEELSLIKDMLF